MVRIRNTPAACILKRTEALCTTAYKHGPTGLYRFANGRQARAWREFNWIWMGESALDRVPVLFWILLHQPAGQGDHVASGWRKCL